MIATPWLVTSNLEAAGDEPVACVGDRGSQTHEAGVLTRRGRRLLHARRFVSPNLSPVEPNSGSQIDTQRHQMESAPNAT